MSGGEDVSLTLAVSLPATYPKTLPQLAVSFSENIDQRTRIEAQHVVSTKPKTLLGAEMIFEIATLLQEALDKVTLPIEPEDVPTLDEERVFQEVANAQKAQRIEEDRQKEQAQARLEEDQILSQMMEQERTRISKRKSKASNTDNHASNDDDIPGTLSFDQSVFVKNSKGAVITLRTVHNKTKYKEGPVTTVSTVQTWASHEDIDSAQEAPCFLVLKECRIDAQKNEELMKKHIQNLESKLDRLKNLG